MGDFLVLVDYSWMLHRSFHAFPDLSVKVNGLPVKTGTLYGCTKLVETILKRNSETEIIFCMDSPFVKRKQLSEAYKSNRSEHPDVYEHKDNIILVLSVIPNVRFAFDMECEADDLMAALFFANQDKKVIIYSGDNDLCQLMCRGAYISRKMEKGRFVPLKVDYLMEKYGVDSSLLPFYKAIRGDQSDNIAPAIPRLSKTDLIEFCVRWRKSPNNVESVVASFWQDKIHQKLVDALPQLKINYELVNLMRHEGKKVSLMSRLWNLTLLDRFKLFSFKRFLEEKGYVPVQGKGHSDIGAEERSNVLAETDGCASDVCARSGKKFDNDIGGIQVVNG
jgi:5'-3' exonuclease